MTASVIGGSEAAVPSDIAEGALPARRNLLALRARGATGRGRLALAGVALALCEAGRRDGEQESDEGGEGERANHGSGSFAALGRAREGWNVRTGAGWPWGRRNARRVPPRASAGAPIALMALQDDSVGVQYCLSRADMAIATGLAKSRVEQIIRENYLASGLRQGRRTDCQRCPP